MRVLFVCLGNICRSPVAEGVFRHKLRLAGLQDAIEVDSAGTGAWHVGEAPDRRMRATSKAHGVPIDDLRARRVEREDLYSFDLILAMDRSNYADLVSFDVPEANRDRVKLFRSFDPEPTSPDVPDPYYGGESGFEDVFEIVSRTCEALIASLKAAHPTDD